MVKTANNLTNNNKSSVKKGGRNELSDEKIFRVRLIACISCLPTLYMALSRGVYLGPVLVMINTLVRLFFPCCYIPARHSYAGWLGHPITARIIATIGEFEYFYQQTLAFGLPWVGPCGFLTTLGEIVCWTSIYYQSEAIAWIEDSIWCTYYLTALLLSLTPMAFLICVPMVTYMVCVHMPRMLPRVCQPYLHSWTGSKKQMPDTDTVAWLIPMLVSMSVTYCAYMLQNEENEKLWSNYVPALVSLFLLCNIVGYF